MPPEDTALPARFLASAEVEGFIDAAGPETISGWITATANPSPHVRIDLLEDGRPVGSVTADIWRTDVAESRQGDGRWGFEAPPPAALADGQPHRITLRLADGRDLLPGPVVARFTPGADRAADAPPAPAPFEYRPWTPTGSDTLISVVVVFYNMAREAARTLHSLSRAYQRGMDGIGYEVICIDNGSAPALDAAWVAGFGPEFRLIRPDRPAASPVAAMNEAAREASGHHLALMIDGAHILSPGALREAADAIAEAPGAVIGLRQWFVGGDQRFLARTGWTRAHEDILFDRIAWPQDGYRLFAIATPVWESPNHWMDAMSESNCLFVPAALFARIGGFEESFDEAGAGFANLDLFVRAAAASADVVALLGEATFHQFHEGTTTNVDTDAKDRKCRAYELKYTTLRGHTWRGVGTDAIRLRGRIRTRHAIVNRQRPLSPAQLGVTSEVRAADLPVHFDIMAQSYLVSVYAEAALQQRAQWRGQPLGVAPPDAFAMAAILHEVQPSRVVAINLQPGLLGFLQDAARTAGGHARFVVMGGDAASLGGANADPADPAVTRAIRRAVGAETQTLVLYQPAAGAASPLAGLRALSAFVSLRSYLVCIGAASGQPWLGYSDRWINRAIHLFVQEAPFAADQGRTEHFITACPNGFLQRIGPTQMGGKDDGLGAVGVH